jgi:hypothetical protein
MAEQPASCFTFEALARALAEVDVFVELPSWNRARRLGISVDHLRLQFDKLLFASRPSAETSFWLRWTAAHATATPDDPMSWTLAFLHQEFRRFCHPPDPRAWQRHQLLSGLTDVQTLRPASAAGRLRLLELGFFPGVLFPWVSAHALFVQRLQTFLRTMHTNLKAHARDCKRFEFYFINHPATRRYRLLVRALQKVCQDVERVLVPVDAWKEHLGLGGKLSVDAQRQRLWTPLFGEMVDLLRPFCSGPKHFHLEDPGTMPDEVYDIASRLMALCQPALWQDSPTRVKARYASYRRTYQS